MGLTPAIVRKSDGATLYATRDLARIKFWESGDHPDIMLNVVDVAQKLYFQQLFAMAKKMNLTDAKNVRCVWPHEFSGKRMSTRKGISFCLRR